MQHFWGEPGYGTQLLSYGLALASDPSDKEKICSLRELLGADTETSFPTRQYSLLEPSMIARLNNVGYLELDGSSPAILARLAGERRNGCFKFVDALAQSHENCQKKRLAGITPS